MTSKKYPVRDHCLIRDHEDSFYDGVTGTRYIMPIEHTDALFNLDGKKPVSSALDQFSKEAQKELLRYFDDCDLLGDGENFWRVGSSCCWSVFKALDQAPFRRSVLSMVATFFLEWVSIPLLIAYIAYLTFSEASSDYFFEHAEVASFILSLMFGLALNVGLHEFAHSIAGRAYGSRTLEAGLFFSITPGGYVLLDERTLKRQPINNVQVSGAGCECNAFLAATLLCLGNHVTDELSPVFNVSALISLLLMNNLIPFSEYFDGGKAIRLLFKKYKRTKTVYCISALASSSIFIWLIPRFLEEYWDLTGWAKNISSAATIIAFVVSFSFYVTLAYARVQQYKCKPTCRR